MKKTIVSAALMMSVATGLLANDADDIWSGEYSGDCGPNVQCFIRISNGHQTKLNVDFIVADRLDDQKIKCKLTGTFQRSALLMIEGDLDNAGRVAIGANNGSMSVFGMPTKACHVTIGGEFFAIGD